MINSRLPNDILALVLHRLRDEAADADYSTDIGGQALDAFGAMACSCKMLAEKASLVSRGLADNLVSLLPMTDGTVRMVPNGTLHGVCKLAERWGGNHPTTKFIVDFDRGGPGLWKRMIGHNNTAYGRIGGKVIAHVASANSTRDNPFAHGAINRITLCTVAGPIHCGLNGNCAWSILPGEVDPTFFESPRGYLIDGAFDLTVLEKWADTLGLDLVPVVNQHMLYPGWHERLADLHPALHELE